MHAINGGASAHDLQILASPLLFVMGHREPRPKGECFDSTIARKPGVSRRFLRLSRLRLLYPLVDPTLLSLHHLRINPTRNGREDLGGSLILHPRHGTDMRGLELLRKFLQHSSPIDSTCPFSRCATLRPPSRSTSLSSERGEFSLVISKPSQFRLFGADLLS
jgi:hypothetical protein